MVNFWCSIGTSKNFFKNNTLCRYQVQQQHVCWIPALSLLSPLQVYLQLRGNLHISRTHTSLLPYLKLPCRISGLKPSETILHQRGTGGSSFQLCCSLRDQIEGALYLFLRDSPEELSLSYLQGKPTNSCILDGVFFLPVLLSLLFFVCILRLPPKSTICTTIRLRTCLLEEHRPTVLDYPSNCVVHIL